MSSPRHRVLVVQARRWGLGGGAFVRRLVAVTVARVAVALLAALVGIASAQTGGSPGGYAIGGVGAARWSSDSGPAQCASNLVYGYVVSESCTTGWNDRNSIGGRFGAGWRFGEWLAIEAVYAYLGQASVRRTFYYSGVIPKPPPDPPGFTMPIHADGTGDYRVQGAELTTVAMLPVAADLSVFGRVGAYAYWQRYREVLTGTHSFRSDWSASNSGVAPVIGVGLAWRATPGLDLRIEWIRYQNTAKVYGGASGKHDAGRFDVDTAWLSAVVALPR